MRRAKQIQNGFFFALFLGLGITGAARLSQASELHPGFTYQGRFLTPDGSSAMTDVVNLIIGIYSPDGNCLLYEQRNLDIDLAETLGLFSVQVGSEVGDPRRTPGRDPGKKLSEVFSNSGQVFATSATCSGGYTSAAGDFRRLRVTVQPLGGASETMSPDLTITPVPQATVAETLQGLDPTKFVQLTGASSSYAVSKNALDVLLGVGGVQDASSLHHHDSVYAQLGLDGSLSIGSGRYLGLGVQGGDPDTTGWDADPTKIGRTWFDSSTSEIKYWDGTTVRSLGTSGAGVASFNGRTGSITLTSADVTTALGYTPQNAASALPAVDGSLLTNLNASSIASGTVNASYLPSASSSTAGILSADDWNAFNAKPDKSGIVTNGNLAMWNASGQLVDGPAPSSFLSKSGGTMAGAINLDSFDLTTTGKVTTGSFQVTGGAPGAGKVLTSDAEGNASWGNPASSQWTTSGSNIYYNDGNVGIGTNSPGQKLTVVGAASFGSDNSVQLGVEGGFGAAYAFGSSHNASGNHAFATGFMNVSSGANSFSGNYFNYASGVNATAFGEANYAASRDQFTVGAYSISMGGNATTWVDTDPLFTIGNGTSSVRSNAMTVLKNGRVGLTTTAPATRFDVRGGSNKASTAAFENIIQAASRDSSNPLTLRMGVKTDATATNRYGGIEVDDAGNKRHLALQPNGGNVGIGTTNPQTLLAVNGTGLNEGNNLFAVSSFSDSSDTNGILLGYDSTGSVGVVAPNSDGSTPASLAFRTYSGSQYLEWMRIAGTGNVGIGTDSPTTKLHVVGTSGNTLKIVDGNQGAGKVLTSDADGIASWATPATAPVTTVAGRTGDVTLSNTDISGLGTAATLNVGVGANNVVQLNGDSKLPAVDGLLLTNLNASSIASGTVNASYLPSASSSTAGILSADDWNAFNAKLDKSGIVTNGNLAMWNASGQLVDGPAASSLLPKSGGTMTGAINLDSFDLTTTGKVTTGALQVTGGTPGEGKVLTSDASGNASWAVPASSQWTTSGSDIYYNAGKVGVGTEVPTADFEVVRSEDILGTGQRRIVSRVKLLDSVGTTFYDGMGSGLALSLTTPTGTSIDAAALYGQNTSGGGTTQGVLAFHTLSSGTLTEKMRINQTGNVGIGTTDPYFPLSVKGAISVDHGNENDGTIASNALIFGPFTSGEGISSKKTPGGNQWGLDFWTSSAPRMSISGSGNVVIGTMPPGARLDVRGTNEKTTIAALENVFQAASNDLSDPLAVRIGLKTDVTAGYRHGAIEVDDGGTKRNLALQPSGGNVGIGTVSPNGKLQISSTSNGNLLILDGVAGATPLSIVGEVSGSGPGGNHSAKISFLDNIGTYGAHILFSSNQTGSGSTNTTEMMRIQNDGNVGINTDTPDAKLHVVGVSGSTLKIVDGNQGAGKVLTSDADGVASWATPATAPVTTVAGRTGDVTLSNSDISGLGTAATLNVGVGANNILQLNGDSKIPAVDGSLLTSLNASSIAGGTVNASYLPTAGPSSAGALSSAHWSAFNAKIDKSGIVTDGNLAMWNGSGQLIDGPAASSLLPKSGGTMTGAINLDSFDLTTTGKVTTGALQVTGGTPGDGKVLTSDATGNATWAAPTASQWTTSGSDILYETGHVRVGPYASGANSRLVVSGSGLSSTNTAMGIDVQNIQLSSTGNTAQAFGVRASVQKTLNSGTQTGGMYGGSFGATVVPATTSSFSSVVGLAGTAVVMSSGGNVDAATGVEGNSNLYSTSGVATAITGVKGSITSTLGTATHARSLYASNPAVSGGTLTNVYGLYIDNITAGATQSYAIYSAGGKSYFAGNVGIGTNDPQAKLDVAGAIYSRGVDKDADTSFDFSEGNTQYTNANCGSFTLSNMRDGGTYQLIVKGTDPTTCSFTHAGLVVRLPPGHGATTSGKHTIYSFVRAGDDVYVSWVPGY